MPKYRDERDMPVGSALFLQYGLLLVRNPSVLLQRSGWFPKVSISLSRRWLKAGGEGVYMLPVYRRALDLTGGRMSPSRWLSLAFIYSRRRGTFFAVRPVVIHRAGLPGLRAYGCCAKNSPRWIIVVTVIGIAGLRFVRFWTGAAGAAGFSSEDGNHGLPFFHRRLGADLIVLQPHLPTDVPFAPVVHIDNVIAIQLGIIYNNVTDHR